MTGSDEDHLMDTKGQRMFLYPQASTIQNRMTRVCRVEWLAFLEVDNVPMEEMMRHCGLCRPD
jgi:hypothetical protein